MENADHPTIAVDENRGNDPSSVQIEIDSETVSKQSSADDMTNAKKLNELNMLKIPEVAHDDPATNRIRSKSFKNQAYSNNSFEERRFSHDAYGFNKNFYEGNLNSGDSERNYMRKSTENTRSQPYEENHIDVKPAKSLDSIIESPTMKLPKQHRIHEYPDKKLNHLSFVSDNIGISKYNDINMNNTLNERNPFGPKINSELMVDNQPIPGTPMDTVSELSNSFDSNISHASLHDKAKPSHSSSEVQSTYDEHYINYPMSSNRIKLASQIIENFKEYESQDPTKIQLPPESRRSISNDQSRKNSDQTDSNERKKRKRKSGDDDRRPSKQDAELLDDPESLMFRDGRRKIDMILCYEEDEQGVMTEAEAKRREQRKAFQENLVKEGLELEIENKDQSFDEKTYFVKVHIPWRTESRYAEVMNMKLPVKRFITISVKAWENENREQREKNAIMKVIHAVRKMYHKFQDWIEYDHSLIEKEPSFHNSTAGGKPEEQFIVKDRCTSFNSAQRSLLVMQILLRTKYDESEKVGIRRLLNDGTYLACFPLHEGRYDKVHHTGICYDRRVLYLEWARPGTWYKKQPLCLVRKYFGDKIALYFCWLGFYTEMLVYPAIVGTICFIYGLLSMNSDDNIPTKEMCDEKGVGSTILCPLCDKACSYQKLHESCLFARITYLFDNPSTVFFAIFMSFWATTFLEIWKRKQSIIVWEWDLHNVDNDEEARPEFETSVKTFRTNPVTREKEPFMPYWQKASRFICTGSAVLFMICVVLAAVLGTIIYRISLVRVIYAGSDGLFRKHAKLLTTMTAATINLIIIMILTKIYHKLAITLTNIENPRTQTEYEDSYTFKIFVFEFMNFYSSLIYIAFFKGRFYDYPGDDIVRKSEFFRLKGDICDPAGCLSELCIQLAIIMVGKQVWNNFMEYLYPAFYNWWRQRQHKKETKDETHTHMAWEQDYHLQDPGRLALFDEYLEMIIQYGFVTLFVAAFPLAPLFALLNNVAEIRLDAYKMVSQARRPLAERVEDIGAWYGILKIITYIAVVSNAFVIAYTSDFIPRMVYKYVYSDTHTLEGYIDHSLSIFNTSDYKEEWGNKLEHDPDTCKYRGYRKPYNSTDPYGLSSNYWHVFAARLAFVVTFEHIVFILTAVMQFVIPDIPVELKTQIRREQLLAKEAKYQHGLMKARENEYEELLQALRDQNNNSRAGGTTVAGSWGRRISKMSDGLDAHIEIVNRAKKSVESTVWEVT